MKIIFFGTPDYVLPILEKLVRTYGKGKDGVVGVVTQPPRPIGRKQFITRSAIDNWAYKRKIPVFHDVADLPQAELGILAAYGKIIPESAINHFKYGILNIHPSLLPQFRGASPIQEAIKKGADVTGVSVIKLDKLMDHGPILSFFKEEIKPNDTAGSLRERLFARSAQFLIDLLPAYLERKVAPKPQEHEKATFTRLLKKEDGYIFPKDFKAALSGKGAETLERLIRAMHPWPSTWTMVKLGTKKFRLRIISAHLEEGKLTPDKVQLEGKGDVSWEEFMRGHQELDFDHL